MNRAIKFRAWDGMKMWSSPMLGYGQAVDINEQIRCTTFTLMQFTGLTDKNGKEIYEGDVVKLHEGWTWAMKWGDELARYYLLARAKPGMKRATGEAPRYIMETAKHATKGEIIGNIYENPELLDTLSTG